MEEIPMARSIVYGLNSSNLKEPDVETQVLMENPKEKEMQRTPDDGLKMPTTTPDRWNHTYFDFQFPIMNGNLG